MPSDNSSGRNWFWWVYAAYLALSFIAYSYVAFRQGTIGTSAIFATALDVVAFVGFYGFLRRQPIASSWLWQLFALLYTGKFISSVGLVIYVATHLPPRHGGAIDNTLLLAFVGAVLALGLVYALYVYAFGSASMWRSKNTAQPAAD